MNRYAGKAVKRNLTASKNTQQSRNPASKSKTQQTLVKRLTERGVGVQNGTEGQKSRDSEGQVAIWGKKERLAAGGRKRLKKSQEFEVG
jgi:hypothetical protein